MKYLISLVVLILLLVSCKDSNNHNAAAEPEPQERRKSTDTLLKTEENESPVHSISTEVKENILYARNEKFTIKIDRLRKGGIRYQVWNSHKPMADAPDFSWENTSIYLSL